MYIGHNILRIGMLMAICSIKQCNLLLRQLISTNIAAIIYLKFQGIIKALIKFKATQGFALNVQALPPGTSCPGI